MKNLPIGISTFELLQSPNMLYVDKTKYLYDLIQPGYGRYFFSRPRRFGKSVTCSTINTIFSGNKALFEHLWIGKSDYQWIQRPVVRFDFSSISHETPERLVAGLNIALELNAKNHGLILSNLPLKEKLAELITTLGQKYGPVVVIIDEYDKPITDLIDNHEQASRSSVELKNFYGTFKGADVDANIYFLFITGVTKFSKVALFSELNNLRDLTNDPISAALVGYTDQELDAELTEHIHTLAIKRKEPYEQTRKILKEWYNGYRFSNNETKVYNPFSLHNCFTKESLENYWFTSGTPTFLMKFIAKNPAIASAIQTVDGSFFAASNLDSFTLDLYYQNYRTLLLQTGYLTFASGYDAERKGYAIAYPNEEVRSSMIEQIMQFIGGITPEQFGEFGSRFRKALATDNLQAFCKHLEDFIKLVPHNIRVDREKFYQQIFFMVCVLFGKRPATEVATEEGFMDLLLEGTNCTFVVEFKKDSSPEIALAQIEAKRYWEPFDIIKGKKIVLAGITFNKNETGTMVLCQTKDL